MKRFLIKPLIITGAFCVSTSIALAQDSWRWDSSNRLLNPSQIEVVPPCSPQIYDIDDDLDFDLIIGQGDGTISLYLNNGFPGNPEWTRDTSFFAGFDYDFAAVPTLQDIDDDDSLELVVSFKFDRMPVDSIRAFRNRGTINDPAWQEVFGYFDIYSDLYPSVTDQKFDDWDSDGDLDMLARCWLDTMYLFFRNIGSQGNPDWSFDSTMSAHFRFDVGPCGYEGFEVADLTSDGALDMIMAGIVCDGPDMINIFINQGTNQTPQFPYYSDFILLPGSGFFNTAITGGDIDGDDDFDLISGGSFPLISYYSNNGNPASPLFSGQGDLNMGPFFINWSRDFAFLDRDFDGDFDFISLYTYVMLPSPRYFMAWAAFDNVGTFEQPQFISASWLRDYLLPVLETGLSCGDINGDTWPDVAWGIGEYVTTQINRPDSVFRQDDSIFAEINALGEYQHPELVDLDQDGFLDLVVLDLNTQTLTAFENTGTATDPSWALGPQLISGLNLSASYANACDMDGNGLPDFILKVGNTLGAYLNIGVVGQPTFAHAPQVLSDLQGLQASYFDVADLDGDGDYDIIVNNDGAFTFVENQSVVGIYSEESRPVFVSTIINYPNPFNAETRISFSLVRTGHAEVTVFDITGKLVADLYNRRANAGIHSVSWNGSSNAGQSVSSGVYFCRLKIDGKDGTLGKMILLR